MNRIAKLLRENGLRKVLCFVLVLIATTALCAAGKVSGAELVDMLPWIFGMTVGGNVLEHYSKAKGVS